MTINDLRCDVCGRTLGGLSGWLSPAGLADADPADADPADVMTADPASSSPDAARTPAGPTGLTELPRYAAGVRFVYHPGTAALRDDSGLACEPCWAEAVRGLDSDAPGRCASCGKPVTRYQSLHLRRFDDPRSWRLCADDAARFLNQLRTVQPKLDQATFRFPSLGQT
jgi:DNA-directed RNA polymerase subunit N (RpoN/RPB10)